MVRMLFVFKKMKPGIRCECPSARPGGAFTSDQKSDWQGEKTLQAIFPIEQ
jgi:hypothetical protein